MVVHSQQLLDIAVTQGEAVVQPDGVTDEITGMLIVGQLRLGLLKLLNDCHPERGLVADHKGLHDGAVKSFAHAFGIFSAPLGQAL
tara:strand:- start:194 stop:451 length:258 start_codon:yes stop_codon:yes gene_type:complete